MSGARAPSPTDSIRTRMSDLTIRDGKRPATPKPVPPKTATPPPPQPATPTPSSSAQTTMSTSGDAITRTKDDFKVDLFYGDRSKLRAYLIQLKLVFHLHRTKYPEGSTQVLFAATYLRGAAFSWFEPYMTDYLGNTEDDREEDTDTMFESLANFEAKLKQVFGVVDEERAAERQIRQLKQQGSASQYYSNFQQLASRLNWDDHAKASAYYMGLSDAVKDKMVPTPPTELQELIDESIKIDNRLYERRMEKAGYYERPYQPRRDKHEHWNNRNQNRGDPMDLDSMERGKKSPRGRPRTKGGRQERNTERDNQRKNNLCFNCGKSGHRAAECAGAAQKLHMMNEETGIVAKKADTTIKDPDVPEDKGTAQKEPELVQEQIPRTEFGTGAPLMQRQGHSCSPWTECQCPGTTCIAHICDGEGMEPAPLSRRKRDDPQLQHAYLSWTACYDNDCLIHLSEKEGSGWFPTKRRRNYRKKKAQQTEGKPKDQESLSMMEEPPEAELADDELANDERDEDPVKFRVIKTTTEYIQILTRWWRKEECTTCGDLVTHMHFIFDPEIKPKKWQHCFIINICQDKKCQYAERLHCHQGNDNRQMELEIPEPIRTAVWGTAPTQNLSMLIEGKIPIIAIWDERGDDLLWARDFECEDTHCPDYYSNHEHRYNVDPLYPDYKILAEAVIRMKEENHVCDDEGCAWRSYQHLHLSGKE
jgi:hypothetical protein